MFVKKLSRYLRKGQISGMKIQIQFYVCVRLTAENQLKSVSFGQQHEYMRAQVKRKYRTALCKIPRITNDNKTKVC